MNYEIIDIPTQFYNGDYAKLSALLFERLDEGWEIINAVEVGERSRYIIKKPKVKVSVKKI